MRIRTFIGALLAGVVALSLFASTALADAPPDWFERAAARGELDVTEITLARADNAPPDWFERAMANHLG